MCYREVEEKDMKHNAAGAVSDQCNTCYAIVGKGAGYANDLYSEKEANEWFEDAEIRKEEYLKKLKNDQ